MDLKFSFNKDAGRVEGSEDGAVTVTPGYYSSAGKYIPVATITRRAKSGPIIGKTAVEVHKDTGEVRTVDLIEEEELPVDKKIREAQRNHSKGRERQDGEG